MAADVTVNGKEFEAVIAYGADGLAGVARTPTGLGANLTLDQWSQLPTNAPELLDVLIDIRNELRALRLGLVAAEQSDDIDPGDLDQGAE